MNDKSTAGATPIARYAVWLVLLAAAGTCEFDLAGDQFGKRGAAVQLV